MESHCKVWKQEHGCSDLWLVSLKGRVCGSCENAQLGPEWNQGGSRLLRPPQQEEPAAGAKGWPWRRREQEGETAAGGRDGPWLWPCAVPACAWPSSLICGFRLAADREADNHTDQNCVDGRKGVLWQDDRCSPVKSVHVSRLGGTCSDCWTPRLNPPPQLLKWAVFQTVVFAGSSSSTVLLCNWGVTGHRLNTPWIKSCSPWETTANQKSLI